MAGEASVEPYRSICLQKGYLTPAQADEMVALRQQITTQFGIETAFLELCEKKGLLTAEQVKDVNTKAQADTAGAAHVSSPTRRGLSSIAGFEILEKIGVGGMGAVFKGRQRSLDRIVAIKILPPKLAKNPVAVERFKREARASAALNHPNIVQGIDVGEDQGLHYFAMEFIDGETARQRMKSKGKLPTEEVIEIGRQTALALAHAHAKGLIHRDIKPDNLMLTRHGDAKKRIDLKVMDLGLARSTDVDDASMTQDGSAIGTPHYLAPEQARGIKDLKPACDLYALGGTMFHLATGYTPFSGETSAVVMAKHLKDPVPDARAVNPDVPDDLAAILIKLLQKEPHARYPSANALAEDLERIAKGQRPEHVTVVQRRRAGTQGQKPVRVRAASAKLEDAPAKPFPVVPVAIGGGVLLVGLLIFVFSGGSESPKRSDGDRTPTGPAPEKTEIASKPPDKPEPPKPPPGPTPEELRRAEAVKLAKAASALDRDAPEDFERIEAAWKAVLDAADGGTEEDTARKRLDAIGQKRRAAADAALAKFIAGIEETARGGDYDSALAQFAKFDPKLYHEQTQGKLAEAAARIRDRARAEGEKLLNAADDQNAAGRRTEALAAFREAAAFKFKETAEAAAQRIVALEALLEADRAAAELASAERVRGFLESIQKLVIAHKWDDAKQAVLAARTDEVLAARAGTVDAVGEALLALKELHALIARRLEQAGKTGLSYTGAQNVYYKLADGRLHYATVGINHRTDKSAAGMTNAELLGLSGLHTPEVDKIIDAELVQKLAPERSLAVAGLLALAGEPAQSKVLLGKSAEKGGEALAKKVSVWTGLLDVLEHGAAEATAAARLSELDAHVKTKAWTRAQDALAQLRSDPLKDSEFAKKHAERIAELGAVVDAAVLDMEAQSVPLSEICKGKIKDAGNGEVEIQYDFSDPAQLTDFTIVKGNWAIADGRLQAKNPPNDGQIWLQLRFAGDTLAVGFEGEAPMDLNCLIGPEIKADTLGGYSFRFGRTKNLGSELVDPTDTVLQKTKARLLTGKPNTVLVARDGKLFTGKLNGDKDALIYGAEVALDTRYVSLQTWEWAWFDNLRIKGKLDAEWLAAKRRAIIAARKGVADGPVVDEDAKAVAALFKGKVEAKGKGRYRISYDFSNADQVQDFVALAGAKPVIRNNALDLQAVNQACVFHKAGWRPPLTLTVRCQTNDLVRLYLAHPEPPAKPHDFFTAGMVMQLGQNHRLYLTRLGRQADDTDYTLPKRPAGVVTDITTADGATWLFQCENQIVLKWTDPEPLDPATYNRWALTKTSDQLYREVSVLGTLDPAWLKEALAKQKQEGK
ncbi:MAG: protein kinase [Planctomycetes bacterium]|nr:protein kinase [Planctomycetota bacterium]